MPTVMVKYQPTSRRLANVGSHVILIFLSKYTAVLRATYLLWVAPVHVAKNHWRPSMSWCMKQHLCCKIQLNNISWTQSSLPLQFGGLSVWLLVIRLHCLFEASGDLVCTINHHPHGDKLARLDFTLKMFTNNWCPNFATKLSMKR